MSHRRTCGARSTAGAQARNHLGEDPAGGDWFVFVNRRRTIVKVLWFDGGGYWVWAKPAEAGRFAEPRGREYRRALDGPRCWP